MAKRMNNLSARLIANAWLFKNGHEPLSPDLSYEDFAAKLRQITARTCVQSAFSSRADATAYIRNFASTKRSDVESETRYETEMKGL